MNPRLRLPVLLILSLPVSGAGTPAFADVIVNASQPVTHLVQVQPVVTRKNNGTVAAFMGAPAEEAYIKQQINRIWAQAGVRIDWLPPASYTSDFAYDGSPGNYNTATRPSAHLDQMVTGTPVPPKSGDARVVNMFFVEIVPAFSKVSDNSANGYARLDGNGIAVHVGTTLLTFMEGRDLVACVLAHEIGHNLGLAHTGAGADNLMSPNGSSGRLTAAQKNTIFTNNAGTDGFDFLQPVPAASGYQQWASAAGVTGGPTGDSDRDGIPNVIEFMLSLDPRASSRLPEPTVGSDGLTWTVTKRPEALADGLVYRVQSSSATRGWLTAGSANSGSVIVRDTAGALAVRLLPGAGRRFMRLSVDIPAAIGAAAPPPPTLSTAAEPTGEGLAHRRTLALD